MTFYKVLGFEGDKFVVTVENIEKMTLCNGEP